MGGVPATRVVAVIANLADGRMQVGSGYLLDASHVLTAAHCTRDKAAGQAEPGLSVVQARSSVRATASVLAMSSEFDVAILKVTGDPSWVGRDQFPPVRLGRLERSSSGWLDDCEAVGYPQWRRSENSVSFGLAEVHGRVAFLENVERKRIVLRDPHLADVGQPTESTSSDSVWSGMSGAALFHDGLLIGVIIEHHHRQGPNALDARPIDAVLSADSPDSARLRDALRSLAGPVLWKAGSPPAGGLARTRVRDWDPYDLGLHSSGTAAGRGMSGRPAARLTPYVKRDLHEPLTASIPGGGLHVILGDSAAGKTRLGYEAAREVVPDWWLVRPQSRQDLRRLADASISDVVIWLENLEEFVGADGLTAGTLNTLCGHGNVAIIATLRITAYDELTRPADSSEGGRISSTEINEVIGRGRAWSEGYSGVLGIDFSEEEIDHAKQLQGQDPRIAAALRSGSSRVAPYLAGAPAAIGRWEMGEQGTSHQVGAALIRAAVDLRRTGYFDPFPKGELLRAYSAYLPPGSDSASPEVIAGELDWASTSPHGLEPCVRVSGDGMCRPFDALVDRAQRTFQGHNPVAPQVWELALELSRGKPDSAFQIGNNAVHYWERKMAIRAFWQAADHGHLDAAYMLGLLLHRAGQEEEAKQVLTGAFEAGHAGAMEALARIFLEEGHFDLAVQILSLAAESGMHMAWYLLADVQQDSLEPAAAEAYRAKTVQALGKEMYWGNADAAYRLGRLLEKPQPEQAIKAYRHAIKYGHRGAPFALAFRLVDIGDPEGAIDVYRQAADRGESGGALNLGVLLYDLGRVEDAIAACRWCADLGDLGVTGNLGSMLWDQGRKQEAMDAWRRGADAGYPGAAFFLGCRLMELGEPREAKIRFDKAKEGFRREMEFGNRDAFFFYGHTCAKLDERDEALDAFRKAYAMGHPHALDAIRELELLNPSHT